jgi:hypothetical protein
MNTNTNTNATATKESYVVVATTQGGHKRASAVKLSDVDIESYDRKDVLHPHEWAHEWTKETADSWADLWNLHLIAEENHEEEDAAEAARSDRKEKTL